MQMESYRAVLPERGTLRLESFLAPPPGPDEVLVQTTKTLISPGTERALLLNLPGLNVQYPKAVGYSHVGKIIQIGKEVKALKVGDQVASKSRHASRVIVKAALCHKLGADLDDEQAAFFQLLATSLQAVRKTRLEIGEAAAVIGSGLIGLFALQVARIAGAMPTIAIDAHPGRLALAKQLGADRIYLAEDALEKISGYARRLPVVIEATGNPAALESACQITASGGRIALLGSSRGSAQSFDFYANVHKKGITLIGAHIHTGNRAASAPGWWTLSAEQQLALKLLRQKRVAVEPLITHRFASHQLEAAYDLLAQWDLDAIGMVIDWT